MRTKLGVPIAVLVIAISSFPAEAQRADRGNRGNQGQGQQRSRSNAAVQPRGSQLSGGGNAAPRGRDVSSAAVRRSQGRNAQDYGSVNGYASRGHSTRAGSGKSHQNYNSGHRPGYGNSGYKKGHGYGSGPGYRGGYGYGYPVRYGYAYQRSPYPYRSAYYGYGPYYYAPRPIVYHYAPPRYYGPGGHLSLYFGFGSGSLYGSVYTGRVYGYRAPAPAYQADRTYGDVRLQVNPRDAAVYVDGYYAGVVDDFDGSSQRLVLETGSHKIEVAVQGAEPQVFDVYVDPARTVELHADLFRNGR